MAEGLNEDKAPFKVGALNLPKPDSVEHITPLTTPTMRLHEGLIRAAKGAIAAWEKWLDAKR